MTNNERKAILNLADTIQGEVNRMCVTKDLAELDSMYLHAKTNLNKLLNMIYDTKFCEPDEPELKYYGDVTCWPVP